MKKAICLLLAIGLLLIYTSCTNASTDKKNNTTKNTTEQITVKEKLSKNCDFVLASGKDWDGSYYELVLLLTDNADYQIGVIKNNEWLQMPDENNPILKVEEMRSCFDKHISDKDVENLFTFVGNGTFFFQKPYEETKYMYDDDLRDGLFYNSNTAKYVYLKMEETDMALVAYQFKFSYPYYNREKYSKEHYEYVIFSKIHINDITNYDSNNDTETFCILNTTTMDVKPLPLKSFFAYVHPISEGLFAVENTDTDTMDFYDIQCEKKFSIDCKDFMLPVDEEVLFQNGQCMFYNHAVENENTVEYKTITIDTNGNEITD